LVFSTIALACATVASVTALADSAFRPHPLLPTTAVTDFSRNFRELEKRSRRPYSLAKVIREIGNHSGVSGFEAEVHEELRALNRQYDPLGTYVPAEVLSRRDLSVSGSAVTVQTSVEPEVIPFLRFKTVTGRLGATLLTDLTGGNWQLPRAIGTGGAAWLAETGGASTAEASFDQITLSASRISADSIVSKQLVAQAQPDIERFLVGELSQAIATEVDRVALNGSGVAPQPTGILNLPVNPAGSYAYNARSPNIAFGGPASWPTVLQFETTIDEGAQVHNDASYGWCAGNGVRQKWMATTKVGTYPSFLWEQPDNEIDGRVAGRKAVNSSQMPANSIIFGRWSDVIIASWAALEILVNPYTYAISAKHLITVNLFAAVNFRYSSAFVTSSDSASQ
jgi:HK97 family phage major capsid protein